MIDFASSFWNHRKELVDSKERLRQLCEAVNRPIDLEFHEWFKLYALVLEFSPDLIIELGRGYGNSTCIFTEAVNKSGKGEVVSIGYDSEHCWEQKTIPSLQNLVSPQWHDKLTIIHKDIMKIDFTEIIQPAKRVLLFWDAHGGDLGKYILTHIFPLLQKKEHLIIVHDITDNGNYVPPIENDGPKKFRIDNFESPFEEIIPLFDYLSSNDIQYDTLRESVTRFLEENEQTSPDKSTELKNTWDELGGDRPLMESHQIYFDINNKTNKGSS